MGYLDFLSKRLDELNLRKLTALNNPSLLRFVGEFVELCRPEKVFVRTDSPEDMAYIRRRAKELGEESELSQKGHTVHFDGYFDQARDKANTKYLLPQKLNYGSRINSMDKSTGLNEVRGYLKEIMKGKEMFICFFCLGPLNSAFSLLAVQVTDSAYVAHAEDILYRPGYEEAKKNKNGHFFKFIHSAGRLAGKVSRDTDKRRVYIDLENGIVYSVNTQYAGNTVGLKKLALRLAIDKASAEDWLAEHMFVMGVYNREGKKVYFCGAYPSMCGKTSTALALNESIVGDDIAYLRVIGGRPFAVNVERGVFGIINDVNAKDDPVLFKALTKETEVIFSNICVDDKKEPFWVGKSSTLPLRGVNFSGEWFAEKKDSRGSKIPPSHKNARYTIRLNALDNLDENLETPQGVEVKGIIYGGRDSDTWSPVEEALSWQQGVVVKGASLESETTAATLGDAGVRVFNPMSNIDFVSVPLGKYIKMHLDFGKQLKTPPAIFSVNYFLKDKEGRFFNAVEDKRVWLKWMRLRVDKSVSALITPTGFIPKYGDLKALFKEVLGKDYLRDAYIAQFTFRVPQNLAKIARITDIYRGIDGVPETLFRELTRQEERLRKYREELGDYISPFDFEKAD